MFRSWSQSSALATGPSWWTRRELPDRAPNQQLGLRPCISPLTMFGPSVQAALNASCAALLALQGASDRLAVAGEGFRRPHEAEQEAIEASSGRRSVSFDARSVSARSARSPLGSCEVSQPETSSLRTVAPTRCESHRSRPGCGWVGPASRARWRRGSLRCSD